MVLVCTPKPGIDFKTLIIKWPDFLANLISYLFISALHAGAHMFNVENLINNWKSKDKVEHVLYNLQDTSSTTYVNPFRKMDSVSKHFFLVL